MGSGWPLILAYHHVVDGRASRYAMPVAAFERHLNRLLERGYRGVTLDEAVERVGRGEARTFTLTFDDGFENLKGVAFPVLERLGLIHASAAFIPTAYVGQDNVWREEPSRIERLRRRGDVEGALLEWGAIEELAQAGVTIGSHGNTHADMGEQPYDEALADATASRSALQEHGFEGRYLAWPYGWYSDDSKRAAAEAGFSAAFSVVHGGTDRYDIRRVPIYGTDDAVTAALKVSGSYFDAFDRTKQLLGRE